MTARLTIDVEAAVKGLDELEGAGRALDDLGTKTSRFDQVGTGAFERIGQRVTDFGANLISSGIDRGIELIGDSITLASDKAEAASKVNILFGDSAGIVTAAAADAATAVGMSSSAYLTSAGDLGNLITNMGITQDEAAGMSTDMLTLAADLGMVP